MHRRNFLLASTGLLVLPTVALAERNNPMPEELRKALERDPTAPILGNPDGYVTLTEFFDYNCPFCRKLVDPIHRLILSDPKLRVFFREWPGFGEASELAARPVEKYMGLIVALSITAGVEAGRAANAVSTMARACCVAFKKFRPLPRYLSLGRIEPKLARHCHSC